MNRIQYAALAVVVLIGLLIAGKALHEASVAEQTRREAARIKAFTKLADEIADRKGQYSADIQACIDKGGVPIKTLITGRLKRCDFPGKN